LLSRLSLSTTSGGRKPIDSYGLPHNIEASNEGRRPSHVQLAVGWYYVKGLEVGFLSSPTTTAEQNANQIWIYLLTSSRVAGGFLVAVLVGMGILKLVLVDLGDLLGLFWVNSARLVGGC